MAQVGVRQPEVRQRGARRGRSLSSETAASVPDKLYFRIGEAAALCGVPAYVLRFWESEFPQLKPTKGGTGQRLYRRRDVLTALRIKELLYTGGFTIPGARQALTAEQRGQEPQLRLAIVQTVEQEGVARVDGRALRQLRGELRELLEMLGEPLPGLGKAARPVRGRMAQTAATLDLFE